VSTLTAADVRILANVHPFHEAIEAMRTFADAMGQAIEAFSPTRELWRIRANSPEAVAGVEGLYHARAALSPDYTTEAAVVALVREILSGRAPSTILLLPEHRATVAAAALRGWTQTRRTPLRSEGLSWGRVLGDTHVLITRAAS